MNKEKSEYTRFIPCNPAARGESRLRRSFLENEELYKTGVWGEFPKVRIYKLTGEEVKERIELMYESPITVLTGDMTLNVDGEITKLVQNFDVHVNQEEIIRALKYDREQYEKGYTDGSKDFAYRLKNLLENTDISIDGPVDCLLEQIVCFHAPLEDDKDLKRAFELLKAEKEGRLLETPCKKGETVFCIWQYSDFTGKEGTPFIEEATAVGFVLDGSLKVVPSGYSNMVNQWYRLIDVCFTREDAEKALETLRQPQTKLATTESTTEKGGEG